MTESGVSGGGDTPSFDKIAALAERGFDLGYDCDENYEDPPEANARITAIYANAKQAR